MTAHFTPFDESYPKVSSIPAWKQAGMVQRLEMLTRATTMGFGGDDFSAMEAESARNLAEAARHAPALEAARLKAMGEEPQQTNWTWFIPWPAQRPAAA